MPDFFDLLIFGGLAGFAYFACSFDLILGGAVSSLLVFALGWECATAPIRKAVVHKEEDGDNQQ